MKYVAITTQIATIDLIVQRSIRSVTDSIITPAIVTGISPVIIRAVFGHSESIRHAFACSGMREPGHFLAYQVRIIRTCEKHYAIFADTRAIGESVNVGLSDRRHFDRNEFLILRKLSMVTDVRSIK